MLLGKILNNMLYQLNRNKIKNPRYSSWCLVSPCHKLQSGGVGMAVPLHLLALPRCRTCWRCHAAGPAGHRQSSPPAGGTGPAVVPLLLVTSGGVFPRCISVCFSQIALFVVRSFVNKTRLTSVMFVSIPRNFHNWCAAAFLANVLLSCQPLPPQPRTSPSRGCASSSAPSFVRKETISSGVGTNVTCSFTDLKGKHKAYWQYTMRYSLF